MIGITPGIRPGAVSPDRPAGGRSEEVPAQRRALASVWIATGSAVAAMVAVSWYFLVKNGSAAPGGDMIVHAATAEWLRTLPWWDWRGWSDWFYGGQAIGVNYPPLPHAWMRFTHPYHGQMAAVAVGLLVLLPWGALRLATAVGLAPRAQRAAVGAVLVLTAISVNMHWILASFHQTEGFFGSWPAMLAAVVGLFCAAWAASCSHPVSCGAVAGLLVLLNPTVAPGVAVVCVVLLITSGARFRVALRWSATAGAAAVAVCAWWLLPFLAGSGRLVRWDIPLVKAWTLGGVWPVAVLAGLAVAAAWAARCGSTPCRRLALASGAGLLAALLGDLFGYPRPERWLVVPILVAAVAAAGLVGSRGSGGTIRALRPAGLAAGAALAAAFIATTRRWEIVPLALWLLLWPRRIWAAGGALAWTGVLLWVPVWSQISDPPPPRSPAVAPVEVVAAGATPTDRGLVYVDTLYVEATGRLSQCGVNHPWTTTKETGGRFRPLSGLYRETSATAEFVDAATYFRAGLFAERNSLRPHWYEAREAAETLALGSTAAAAAFGSRWHVACDPGGGVTVTELPGVAAVGVMVDPYAAEESWHRAAVEWWLPVAAGNREPRSVPHHRVPVLSPGEAADRPFEQAAGGVSLEAGRDILVASAATAGWAWLRIPWDPDWRAVDATPVHKGGPGHLIVWLDSGTNEFHWSVPREVDVAAGATTGVAALAVLLLAVRNRRLGWELDDQRRRPASEALEIFADTVDGWVHSAIRRMRRSITARGRGRTP